VFFKAEPTPTVYSFFKHENLFYRVKKGDLFEALLAARGKKRELTDRAIDRVAAWMMVKRKLKNAGIPTIYSNHSFRAAGITNFLENVGNLEVAQRIAGHADSRTTKLYDRRYSSRTWNGFGINEGCALWAALKLCRPGYGPSLLRNDLG